MGGIAWMVVDATLVFLWHVGHDPFDTIYLLSIVRGREVQCRGPIPAGVKPSKESSRLAMVHFLFLDFRYEGVTSFELKLIANVYVAFVLQNFVACWFLS